MCCTEEAAQLGLLLENSWWELQRKCWGKQHQFLELRLRTTHDKLQNDDKHPESVSLDTLVRNYPAELPKRQHKNTGGIGFTCVSCLGGRTRS